METCGRETGHQTYYKQSTTARHYKSASDGDSPDASVPMGNLSNALVDSGYREDSGTYNHSELLTSCSPLTDETATISVPPAIFPVSGQLEKFKKHHMIRPVPLKAASPSRSLDSPSSTSSRHSFPSSPAIMPDHTNDQEKHHHHQPPDLVLTNQQQTFAGNHFAGLPTKCLSLQDITPKQKNYHENRLRAPSYGDSKAWGKQPIQARPIQPAHSLNYLNRNLQSHKLLPDYRRRDISQSAGQVDNRHNRSNAHKKPVRITHTNPSYGHAMDYNSNRLDGKSSASSSSRVSSVREEAEMAEIVALRQKVLEKEAQLSTLRDTMDNNEAVILKVHEEKRQQWEEETSWLRKELQDQEDTSRKIRHSLQTQIYKLEQEKKSLRERIEATQQPVSKEMEDLKWQLRNLRDQLSIKSQEIANMRKKLVYQEQHLNEKAKTVACMEAELERNSPRHGAIMEDSQDILQRLVKEMKEKEAELNEARIQTNHIQELKENLSKEVKVQQEELTLLRNKISCKDKELSQERCEITYLREVQEKLNLQLQRKSKSGGGLLGRGNQSGNSNQLKDKLVQKEKEVAHVKEQLKKLQDEKEQETGKLQLSLKEKNGEIERLQKKVTETEKDRGLLRNKLANGKGGCVSKMTPLQRQLESDFMDLQVKLTTREREVFQLKRKLALLQEKKDDDIVSLKSHLKDQEQEHIDLQNKLYQQETDIGFLVDKLKSRDSEISSLREKLKTNEVIPSDIQNDTPRVEEMKRDLASMESVHQDLNAQIADLKEESAMYKEKLDKIYQGVRCLSTSQSNLINAHLGKDKVPLTGTQRVSEEGIEKELRSLKADLAEARDKIQSQEATMAQERRIWQEEKEKVIKYQKQLQLNYVQMCRRNRTLESDLQQMTMEIEHKEISHC